MKNIVQHTIKNLNDVSHQNNLPMTYNNSKKIQVTKHLISTLYFIWYKNLKKVTQNCILCYILGSIYVQQQKLITTMTFET